MARFEQFFPYRLLKFSTIVAQILLSTVTSFPSARQPATNVNFYVSQNGSDRGDGSAKHPWRTLQRANAKLAAGVTVHVGPGTYEGPIVTKASGSPIARIRFVADRKWQAIITTRDRVLAAWTIGSGARDGDYVDVEGFEITGNARNGILTYGSFNRIAGNHVHDLAVPCDNNGGSGINSQELTAGDNEINGNVVHGIHPANCSDGKYHGVGIYILNPRGTVTNNIVYGNGSVGIQLSHNVTDEVVSNNLVFGNAYVGIWVGCADSGCVLNDHTIVTNNIVLNHPGCGIRERGTTGRHNVYDRNIVYQNQAGDLCLQNGNVPGLVMRIDPQAGNLFAQWRNDGSGDYHLKANSPAAGTGTSLGAPPTDFDGKIRMPGSRVDIGPFRIQTSDQEPARRTQTHGARHE